MKDRKIKHFSALHFSVITVTEIISRALIPTLKQSLPIDWKKMFKMREQPMSFFEQAQSRREFLRRCARRISLIAIGLVGSTLLARKQIKRSSQECINEGICDGCRVFSRCILPQALSAKKNESKDAETELRAYRD